MAVVITRAARACPFAVFLWRSVSVFCATAPLPDGLDEFLLAGYLRKQSIELIKADQ